MAFVHSFRRCAKGKLRQGKEQTVPRGLVQAKEMRAEMSWEGGGGGALLRASAREGLHPPPCSCTHGGVLVVAGLGERTCIHSTAIQSTIAWLRRRQ